MKGKGEAGLDKGRSGDAIQSSANPCGALDLGQPFSVVPN